jgi:hypothetical protein
MQKFWHSLKKYILYLQSLVFRKKKAKKDDDDDPFIYPHF